MYNDKKIIGIIPARSGSKGLKDKNIKELCGKPLIAYTIEAAKQSGVFDCIMVSTDSEKYARIAREYGASVPFLRSSENSSDKSGSWDVVREVLANLNEKFDIVVLLQPTSPLRTSQHIKEAVDLFFEKDADTVCSVCETPHPMFWCNTLNEDLSMMDFIKKEYQKRRQELPKSYTLNGAIYICKTKYIDNLDFYSNKSFAYVMNKNSSIDIDENLDFQLCELIIKNVLNKK
jgi:CMP-N,N'-diacetyllegionaminic acid synthase